MQIKIGHYTDIFLYSLVHMKFSAVRLSTKKASVHLSVWLSVKFHIFIVFITTTQILTKANLGKEDLNLSNVYVL